MKNLWEGRDEDEEVKAYIKVKASILLRRNKRYTLNHQVKKQ